MGQAHAKPYTWRAAALVSVAIGAGGCGAGPGGLSAPIAPVPAARGRAPTAQDQASHVPGGRIFVSQCSACHTLGGPPQARPSGGDLIGYQMTAAQVAGFVSVMPLRRRLTPLEIRLVSDYVAAREHARGRP